MLLQDTLKTGRLHCSRCRIYQYNEDDFRFQILTSTKLLNSMKTHKHGNKKKRSIYSFSWFTRKLVI